MTLTAGTTRDAVRRHPHATAAFLALVGLAVIALSPQIVAWVREKGDDGRWRLTQGPDGVPVGLEVVIDRDEIRVEGPCRSVDLDWSQDDGVVDGRATIEPPPCDLIAQEDVYLQVLGGVDEVEVDGDILRLCGAGGCLTYARVG